MKDFQRAPDGRCCRIPSYRRGCAPHNPCRISPARNSCVLVLYGQVVSFFYHTEAESVNYTSQIQITQPCPITDGLVKKHDRRAKGKEVSGGDLSGMHGIFPTWNYGTVITSAVASLLSD